MSCVDAKNVSGGDEVIELGGNAAQRSTIVFEMSSVLERTVCLLYAEMNEASCG